MMNILYLLKKGTNDPKKFRTQAHLRELLNLTISPQSKETKKCNSKGDEEHRLNTE
jgi:hypothetical protein